MKEEDRRKWTIDQEENKRIKERTTWRLSPDIITLVDRW